MDEHKNILQCDFKSFHRLKYAVYILHYWCIVKKSSVSRTPGFRWVRLHLLHRHKSTFIGVWKQHATRATSKGRKHHWLVFQHLWFEFVEYHLPTYQPPNPWNEHHVERIPNTEPPFVFVFLWSPSNSSKVMHLHRKVQSSKQCFIRFIICNLSAGSALPSCN